MFDELVKNQELTLPVIPAKAGIQEQQALLDPGFRRGDGFDDFLRSRQVCPPRKKSQPRIPFMVRYLTTNGRSDGYGPYRPFALRYRRVNGTFYERIKFVRATVTLL